MYICSSQNQFCIEGAAEMEVPEHYQDCKVPIRLQAWGRFIVVPRVRLRHKRDQMPLIRLFC